MTALKIADVAARLQCTPAVVRRLIEGGTLRAIDLNPGGANRVWRVPELELERFVLGETVEPEQAPKRGRRTAEDETRILALVRRAR